MIRETFPLVFHGGDYRRYLGPLLVITIILAVQVLWFAGQRMPNLSAVLLVAVMFSTATGGRISGIFAGALAFLYYAFYQSRVGAPFRYTLENLVRVLIDAGSIVLILGILGGITRRLDRALGVEQTLRARADSDRKRINGILESVTDGFFAVDAGWRLTFVNRRAEQLLGRSPDRLVGRILWAEVPELSGTHLERECRRALEDQVDIHLEEFFSPRASWFEIHIIASPEGLGVYFRQINERRQAEDALRARARQQAAVADLGQLALKGAGLATLMNETARSVADALDVRLVEVLELLPGQQQLLLRAGIGWKDGLVGHATVDALSGSQAAFTLCTGRPVVVEDLRLETRFFGPPFLLEQGLISGMSVLIQGRSRPFGILGAHTTVRRLFIGEDVNFLQAVANVLAYAIERRHDEEALEESERRFRQIAENIRDVFWMTNADGSRFLYVSPPYEQMWQRSVASLYEAPESWKDLVHPEDRPKIDTLPAAPLAPQHVVEYRSLRPDGQVRWVVTRAFPIIDDRGEVYRIVGITEDVTERKSAEENAYRLAIEQNAREAAEAGMRARDEILAIVSHDLRNPLSTISLSARLLEHPLPEDKRLQQLGRIERAAQLMERLIQDLLEVARIEAGRLAVEPLPIPVTALLGAACEAFRAQAAEKGIELQCQAAEGLPPVAADRDRILQALSNLLGNALKFTPPGGRITVRAEPFGDEVRVSVADTGMGLSPEHLEHIFERYWQGPRTARAGAGLGLFITKGIVEAHGGRIWVESEVGQGTTIYLTLPRAASAAPGGTIPAAIRPAASISDCR